MKRVLFSLFFILMGIMLTSANLNLQITGDPTLKYLEIRISDEKIQVNLESPGLVLEKYSNGTLRYLAVPFINSHWHIYFHPSDPDRKTRQVSLVQRVRLIDNHYLLDGLTQRFDSEGNLLSESSWKEGILHGKQKTFHRRGQIVEELEYEMGFPVNTWKQYYVNGVVATEVTFPSTKEEWGATQEPKIVNFEPSVFSMAYHTPIVITERWYDQDAILLRELSYKVYQDSRNYVIANTRESIGYDEEGRIVHKTDFSEAPNTGIERRTSYQFGLEAITKEIWYEGESFNKSDF